MSKERDSEISHIEAFIITAPNFVTISAEDHLADLCPVILELRRILNLFPQSIYKLLVYLQVPVLPLQSLELIFSHQLVGDKVQFELLVPVLISEDNEPFGLSLLDTVDLITFLELHDLADDVLSMISDSQERILDAILKVSMLDPLAKLAAPHTNLLELLQGDFLDSFCGSRHTMALGVESGGA